MHIGICGEKKVLIRQLIIPDQNAQQVSRKTTHKPIGAMPTQFLKTLLFEQRPDYK